MGKLELEFFWISFGGRPVALSGRSGNSLGKEFPILYLSGGIVPCFRFFYNQVQFWN